MRAFTSLADLGECSGVDLWRSHAPTGGTIRAIFNRAKAFPAGSKPWPGRQPPTNAEPFKQAFAEAGWAYGDPSYLVVARQLPATDYATDEDFRWGGLTIPLAR